MKSKKILFLIIIFIFHSSNSQVRIVNLVATAELQFEVDYGVSDVDWFEGKFYLTDSLANQIIVCDEKGQMIKTIGKKGQGPGEFGPNSPTSVLILPENIIVNDPGGFKIQIFKLNGNFMKQYKYMSDIPLFTVQEVYALKENMIGLYGLSFEEAKEGSLSMRQKFIAFSIDSGASREIYNKDVGKFDIDMMKAFNPFSVFPIPVVANDLIFQADKERYKIDIFSLDGRKINEIIMESKAIIFNNKLRAYFSEKEEFKKVKNLSQGMIDFAFPSQLPILKRIVLLKDQLFVWTWKSWYEKNFENKEVKFYGDIYDPLGNFLGIGVINFNPEEIIKVNGKKIYLMLTEGEKKIIKVMTF